MIRTVGVAAAVLALATAMPVQQAAAQDVFGGALMGGLMGGAIGGLATGRGGGVAVGAIIGATTGAIIASEAQRNRTGYYAWRGGCYQQDHYGNWYQINRRYCY